MSDYIVRHNVPVIDEHTLTDSEGQPLVRIDENVLRKIADRNNQRVRDSGDEVPTIVGHTVEGAAETDQPPLVDAWWSNFRVAPFFKTGRKCVTASVRFHKKLLGLMRKYPRRSVELWLGDYKIDPIALLGPTTPERDLGLLRLAADGRKVIRRVLPEGRSMDPKAVAAEVLKMIEQSDVWQYCKQKMAEEQAPEEGPGDMGGLPGEDGEGPLPGEEGQGAPPPEAVPDGVGDEELEGQEPVRQSASTASGSNSFTPGMGKKKAPAAPARYSRQARKPTQLELLAREHASLKVRFARAERKNDLLKLQNEEGIELDVEEELDDVQHLDDARYAKHLGKIKARYSRSGPFTSTDWSTQAASQAGQTDRAGMEAIASYAQENGLSYEKARAALGYA